MEVVNNVSGSCRRKKTLEVVGEVSSVPVENSGEDGVAIPGTVTSLEPILMPIGEVVRTSQSGVDLILGDNFGDDMDIVELGRNDPGDKRSDAEHILEIQLDLGLNFIEEKEVTVDRLVGLEERDRENLARCQESHGFQ
jgi:hypothetical protein